ncbi:MAG: DUF998 domain-containing protein [Candidatus Aenigmarchaeota archaeon]|nr:DUF998 domain-containing protein [Candidatus Aenigmarchaeota archaeon]
MIFKRDKFLTLSGFFGPIIFAAVILIAGFLSPNYDHANQVISDLGAVGSPVKDFMNIFGFMLFGILIMAFSVGVYKIRGSLLGKAIAALFMLGGLAMFLIGVFPSDAVCREGPCPQPSLTGEMHNISTIGTFLLLFPAFVLLVIDTRNEKSMRYYFIVAGILGAIIAFSAHAWLTAADGTLIGVKQRITLGAFSLLLMYTSAKLYRLKAR